MKSRKAVSEVLATVIIIALVLGAGGIVAAILTTVNVVDLPGYFQTPEPKEVNLSLNVVNISDLNFNSFYDTIELHLSLDAESPTIYIRDIDLLLPTGNSLDEITPWIIDETSQILNETLGYYVHYGTINSTFIIQINDMGRADAEIQTGSSLYFIIEYVYYAQGGSRIERMTSYFQSSLFTFP
ncbi:MAG: hypothetical protein ACFFDS_00855 [Candidatus Thorarchaeota archaeon]